MNFEEHFLSIKNDATGSVTKDRYDYQLCLTVFMMLDKYFSDEDFIFLFEYLDDFIIINNNADNHKEIDFYQVKTLGRKEWSFDALMKEKVPEKIYKNKINFPNSTKSVNFISNRHCDFMSNLFNRECANNVLGKPRKSIIEKAIKNIDASVKVDFGIMFFEKADLALEGYNDQLIGKLSSFVSKIFNPDKFNVNILANSLLEMAKKRSNKKIVEKVDYEGLLKLKGISKQDLKQWLDQSRAYIENKVTWEEILTGLPTNNAFETKKLKNEFSKYILKTMNPDDFLFNKLRDDINSELLNEDELDNKSLYEISEILTNKLSINHKFDKRFIKIGVMYEFCAN